MVFPSPFPTSVFSIIMTQVSNLGADDTQLNTAIERYNTAKSNLERIEGQISELANLKMKRKKGYSKSMSNILIHHPV